ncbi:MAG: hypothetical protein HND47_16135 [Chloroflexi bacterium]|nr:hypothetical protein [Chloroflexota bacterium]
MKIRLFFTTYIAATLSLVAYGVLALLNPGVLLDSFLLRVYQFPNNAATAVEYLSALYRLLGFFNIIPGILGLVLLRQYQLSRQTWILKVVIASSLLSHLGPIVFDNTVGDIGFFEMIEHVLFVAMILPGGIMLRDWSLPRSAHESIRR